MTNKLKISGFLLSFLLITGCSNDNDTTVSGGSLSEAKSALCEKETMRVMFGKGGMVKANIVCDKESQATNISRLESMRASEVFLDIMPKSQKITLDMTNVTSNVSVALLDNHYKIVEIIELKPGTGVTTSNQKADYVFKGSWGLLDDVKVGDSMEVKEVLKFG